jgi:cobaltochelatase CobT
MASPQAHARRQQKLEETCAAAIRALTGEPGLHYRDRRLYRGTQPVALHAPHLRTDPETDSFGSYRGAADGMALRLRHSDAELHRRLCPDDPVERLMFELLEQLRVEALVPPTLPGSALNLHHRFAEWSRAFHRSGLTESSLGILLYTVSQICWSRLTGRPVLEQTEDLIEATRAAIVPALGAWLAGLRRHRNDQAAFAEPALEIARFVSERIRAAREEQSDVEADSKEDDTRAAFSLLLDFDNEELETMAVAITGQSKTLEESESGYRIYTTRYDQQLEAGALVRKALLQEFRERLDRRISSQGINIARLARQLMALLAAPQRDGWSFGEEQGYIDGRRLAQLISSPAERRLFRQERYKPVANCLVSFLVDCSGSMKAHIEPVTVLIDILVRALEQAGAATEVLGFTTGAWNGGRAQRDWLSRGRPKNPGRLNEVCHLVFKDAGRSWRRARADIAALLKADLFREGVDGEAVDWAVSRMLGLSAERKILIVISDGSPMDSATNLANDAFYLDNHLKQVVAHHEQQRAIEILGIGVGLDLSPYYRRSLATDLSRSLDHSLFTEIVQLIGGRQRR